MGNRSVGVTVFGLMFILFPVSNVFLAGVLGYHYTTLQNIFRGLFLSFSMITGIGVLLLKEWARRSAMVFAVIAILVLLLAFIVLREPLKIDLRSIVDIWIIVYGCLILVFFTRPGVKGQFN